MKNYLLILITLFLSGTYASAQVGIGTATPDTKSILDLTNSNNKYLLLPIPNAPPSTITSPSEGAMIYYKGVIYFQTAAGLRAFTPWNWDGDSTHAISTPVPAQVGIGIIPQASHVKMQIADSGQVNVTTTRGALAIGNINANHLLFDNDEIMAKTNPNTAGTLRFQKNGGTVSIGDSATFTSTTTLAVTGSIDAVNKGKIRENGNDLLPQGSIIMWSGTAVPAGWALCDGGSYTLIAGGSVTTPNLMDRFIIAGNATGGTGTAGSHAIGATGGNDNITLSISQMPAHDHGGTTGNAGSHTHSVQYERSITDTDGGGGGAYYREHFRDTQNATVSTAPDHAHTISSQGSGSSIDIRPSFFTLAYIMKL
jgi:microcystin-dependent protein